MTALLTIAIPTYNRAANLEFLLDVLQRELSETDEVDVIVSDNASTDGTAAVIAAAQGSWPALTVLRNATNIGADANIAQLFERAATPYLWIIGDDDVPYNGAIAALLGLLQREQPDLVALPSSWVADVRTIPSRKIGDADSYAVLGRDAFARQVNVWTTFLSGIVVNKQRFGDGANPAAVRRFAGSNLIQLGWVLAILATGTRFVRVLAPWVVATGGASGGYAVIRTFGVTLPDIAETILGPTSVAARVLIARTLTRYLPQLVWNVRFGSGAQFAHEDVATTLRGRLARYPAYWLAVRPIAQGSKATASAALLGARLVAAIERRIDTRRQ